MYRLFQRVGLYALVVVRFVHSADWQLGKAPHYLSDEARTRFSAARIDVIGTIGNLAVQEHCDFVVVCGDVFESNHIDRQVLVRALEKMRATPQVTFYLLPGNHDPLDASSIYRSPTFEQHRPGNVALLDGSEPLQAEPGVELIAAPWQNKRPLSDLVGDACEGLGPADAVRVVVGHGAVDSLSPDPGNPALISLSRLQDKIDKGSIHYVALGDRHSTTDVGATGRVWYSGAPEPTDYDEVEPGNVLVVELDAHGVGVERRAVGTWRFDRSERALSSDADIDAVEKWLSGLPDKQRTIVKVALVGQVSVAQRARLDGLLAHHRDLFAALETWERRSELVVIPDDADLDDFGLSGYAREALSDLRTMAESDDEQAVTAREALALLYRLVEAPK